MKSARWPERFEVSDLAYGFGHERLERIRRQGISRVSAVVGRSSCTFFDSAWLTATARATACSRNHVSEQGKAALCRLKNSPRKFAVPALPKYKYHMYFLRSTSSSIRTSSARTFAPIQSDVLQFHVWTTLGPTTRLPVHSRKAQKKMDGSNISD